MRKIIETDDKYEEKSKIFDCAWLLKKLKTAISGIDTKISLRVSLHAAMINFLFLKQYSNKTNDACLTRFKSTIHLLIIIGGKHILVSELTMEHKFKDATKEEEKREDGLIQSNLLYFTKATKIDTQSYLMA